MSTDGGVVAEPELGDGTPDACSVTELWGQVILVHECLGQQGTFYRIISDGPVEIIAPEVRITGKLVLQGDLEITGDLTHTGATRHNGLVDINGHVRVDGEVGASQGFDTDPAIQF